MDPFQPPVSSFNRGGRSKNKIAHPSRFSYGLTLLHFVVVVVFLVSQTSSPVTAVLQNINMYLLNAPNDAGIVL